MINLVFNCIIVNLSNELNLIIIIIAFINSILYKMI